MARRVRSPWYGPSPIIHPPMPVDKHGGVFSGLWHSRMVAAWRHAWESCLVERVMWHGETLYSVPSQTTDDKWYVVHRFPLAPDGYLYICDCPASEKGGVVCAHGMAVYLWRLRHRLRWRLKRPTEERRPNGDDATRQEAEAG
jgi:hypothetical protein